MSRSYDGDISGEFWFGVQSSDDADFFGVQGDEIDVGDEDGVSIMALDYSFRVVDYPKVTDGIRKCREFLGDQEQALNKFFATHNGYNDRTLSDAGFSLREIPKLLEWYSRLLLGLKIEKALQNTGKCDFVAEK